jgi:hypothetical protein
VAKIDKEDAKEWQELLNNKPERDGNDNIEKDYICIENNIYCCYFADKSTFFSLHIKRYTIRQPCQKQSTLSIFLGTRCSVSLIIKEGIPGVNAS